MENKEVTIYSTPTCVHCNRAKAFFDEHRIDYTNYDVSTDQKRGQEMVEKTGQMGVPVIIVGEDIVVGFDQARLRELLEIPTS